MLTKQKLSYKALPLPDRHEMSDAEMEEGIDRPRWVPVIHRDMVHRAQLMRA